MIVNIVLVLRIGFESGIVPVMHWLLAVRWIHVLAATAWFGEVVTINLVLVPALTRMGEAQRAAFLGRVFPKLFRLASILSLTAVLSGLVMFVTKFSGHWDLVFATWSGRAFVAGGSLAILLTAFHFLVEPRLGKMIEAVAREPGDSLATRVVKLLRVIPRAGLGVITGIVLLMMVGARGL